jgi:hypothetical protein
MLTNLEIVLKNNYAFSNVVDFCEIFAWPTCQKHGIRDWWEYFLTAPCTYYKHKQRTFIIFLLHKESRSKCWENKIYIHVLSTECRTKEKYKDGNKWFENVAQGEIFGKNTNKPYCINKEIKIRLTLMSACYTILSTA